MEIYEIIVDEDLFYEVLEDEFKSLEGREFEIVLKDVFEYN